MMTLFIFILSFTVFGAVVPIDNFDQSKLAQLMEKMPGAFQQEQIHTGFKRKTYQFLSREGDLKIECSVDYYPGAKASSAQTCRVEVSKNTGADEVPLRISDKLAVEAWRAAISYGKETKKYYSTERIHGKSLEGKYRELFRYSIICGKDQCDLTFALI